MTWLLIFSGALLAALLSGFALMLTTGMRKRISWGQFSTMAVMGGALGAFGHMNNLHGEEVMILSALGAFLTSGAIIDHQTGWAPDLVMLPLVILSVLAGGIIGTWGAGYIVLVPVAIAIFLAAQAIWIGTLLIPGVRDLPPGDMLALSLPTLVFGAGIEAIFVMACIAIALAALMLFPGLSSVVRKKEVLDDILENDLISEEGVARGGTVLTLVLPVTYVAVFIGLAST